MDNSHLTQREYVQVQVALAQYSPIHLRHLIRETGRENFDLNELVMHFASHKNPHGRSFASVFAKLYRRYEVEILSDDNIWYTGGFYHRPPTRIEATLFYFAHRRRFGLSLERLYSIDKNQS